MPRALSPAIADTACTKYYVNMYGRSTIRPSYQATSTVGKEVSPAQAPHS